MRSQIGGAVMLQKTERKEEEEQKKKRKVQMKFFFNFSLTATRNWFLNRLLLFECEYNDRANIFKYDTVAIIVHS